MHMRKLLLLYILLLLCSIPAKTSLSLALFPQEKSYVLSLAHQGTTSAWDGQVTFTAPDEEVIMLPSRFKIGMGDVSLSLGYAGFWTEYALLPLLARKQALFFQANKHAIALMLPRTGEKKAIGYEHTMARGNLSVFAWMQPEEEPHSFQTRWGDAHARWGVVSKIFLTSSLLDLGAELLFTPVQGLEGFILSTYKYRSSKLSLTYGQEPYPTRYSFALDLNTSSCSITFVMEDWFGPRPIYGGFSAIRRRSQSFSLRIFLGTGYLLFSFSDLYEFNPRGTEVGSVMMSSTWKASFGQLSVQCGQSRVSSILGAAQYKVSLVLSKVSFSYTEAGYEITLSDSIAIGKGIGTWKLKKCMGEAVSLSLLYTMTSDL